MTEQIFRRIIKSSFNTQTITYGGTYLMRYVSLIMFVVGLAVLVTFTGITIIDPLNHVAGFGLIAIAATSFIGSIAANLLSKK